MRYLMLPLLIALASGCASNPKPAPVLIHDFCLKDKILYFDSDVTIDYLQEHEAAFLRAYVLHNETHEAFCAGAD